MHARFYMAMYNNVELLEQQWEKLMAEKEEAIQDLERNFKRKLVDAETKFRYF